MKETNSSWYTIDNIDDVDSPALVVYPDRVKENIRILKTLVPDITRLRPHMKTNKSAEVAEMLLEEGITKFKCATIAEAEMLAGEGAPDILLAYQPVGPKAHRLAELVSKFPTVSFACLVDNEESASHVSSAMEVLNKTVKVYLDLNVGMNRTGIKPEDALPLYRYCLSLKGLTVAGLHAYDGHLRDVDFAVRTEKCNEAFVRVDKLRTEIISTLKRTPQIIAGGTPTFPIHAKRDGVECSPGTFIYWDKGYQSILQEQPFVFAALVVSRVISIPAPDTICIDLGHKAIASENPLANRVSFLNAPDLEPTGHSEEHMTLRTGKENKFAVGDVLYGVPYHICPTVALHETVQVIRDHHAGDTWTTQARKRKITV